MSRNNATLITAVRHGETEWNAAGRQQGHLDSPLTESGRNRYNRNWFFFRETAEKYQGKHLLISTHGGVLESLIQGVLSIPLGQTRSFSLINGSINRFLYDGGRWMLLSWGETAHMEGLSFLDDS